MLPEIWGRYGWNFLHLITYAYPDNPNESDKKHYYEYFHTLQYVLPCAKCQYNMSHHLRKYPLTNEVLSCKANIVRWGIDLHNVVNYYLGKPLLTYKEALNEINKLLKPDKPSNDIIYYLLIIIAIIIIIYLVYYYVYKSSKN